MNKLTIFSNYPVDFLFDDSVIQLVTHFTSFTFKPNYN